jgi:hypothetical protein
LLWFTRLPPWLLLLAKFRLRASLWLTKLLSKSILTITSHPTS